MRNSVVYAVSFLFIGVVTACGPLGADDPTAVGTTPAATRVAPSTLPPMRIATRTPVDPANLPATQAGTPASVEVPPSYVVQEGDSLYAIAIRFNLDLAEIVAINGLSDPNDISVGQELTLPAPPEE